MSFKQHIVFIVLMFITGSVFAQTRTDERYERLGYSLALKGYEKELQKQPANSAIRHKLALAYLKVGQSDLAYNHYKQLVLEEYKGFTKEDWNNYGHLCLSMGQIVEAIQAFNHLDHSALFKKPIESNYFIVEPLEQINTEYAEFSPVLLNDQLVFVSDRPASPYDLNTSEWSGTPYLSIFTAERDKLQLVRLFSGQLNDSYHNGPISFSNDGMTAYLTRSFIEDKTGLNQSQLFVAKKEKNSWNILSPLEFTSDKLFSFAHPVFLPELNMLVFSSNLSGGYGQMDLYYCVYKNDQWGELLNFGQSINTPFNDVFPCANPHQPTSLYFSSNGYIGYGGLDIFVIQYKNGQWSAPELLPQAINSSFDDFGICFSNEHSGYMSSNRRGGKGRDDLYSFKIQEFVAVEGILVDAEFNKPLANKKLYLVDESLVVFDSVMTDTKGYFVFTKMPYQNVGLKPLDEEGIEMIIRPLNEQLPRDPYTNIKLLSSRKVVLDSIALTQTELVTYVLESASALKKRCVQYENGDKAVLITFNVKDERGNTIDRITSDRNGCFIIKKLYPEKSYLQLIDELQSELQMRFVKAADENNTNWQKESDPIQITSLRRCVVYENGDEAVQINFAVKDSSGTILDLITTDEKGCFQIRKLYNQKTYLELMEDELVEMGLKIMIKDNENEFEWNKSADEIVLKSATLCLAYITGNRAVNMKFDVKDSAGRILSGIKTDDSGCFQIRKMYDDKTYFELIDERDAILRSQRVEEAQNGVLSVDYIIQQGDAKLTAQLFDYKNLQKDFTGLKVVFFDESGMISKVSSVSKKGEFLYPQLSSSKAVLMMLLDENGVLQGSSSITIKGAVSPVNKFIQADNLTFYIINELGEKYLASKLKSDGKFEFDLSLEDTEIIKKNNQDVSFETISATGKNEVVLKNLYFESGKWDITKDMAVVLDELIGVIKKNPSLTVHIKAHTDSRGHSSDNLELSNNRANSVSEYLQSKGVSNKQYTTKGYGETRLINHCMNNVECSDEEHLQNRRIEFEFIWK
jgi:outer membrane protein OmpA-like peptidoglycan-associated protein